MALKELGVFLSTNTSTIGKRCCQCGITVGSNMRVAEDESGVLCATCHLRGVRIQTPQGPRVVQRIKDGDGSVFPVIATDGTQWKDEEVTVAQPI